MKTYIIKEYDSQDSEGANVLDLTQTTPKHCAGCFSCWLTTPGRCIYKDLDNFYQGFLAADKAVFYCEVSQGFISSNLKAVIDRMIPLVLPYISWPEGESLHDPRYTRYPAVEVVYRGDFLPGEEDAFVAYWKRTLGTMFLNDINVRRDETAREAGA